MHYKNGRELTFDEAYAARVLYVFKECPPEEALMKGMEYHRLRVMDALRALEASAGKATP